MDNAHEDNIAWRILDANFNRAREGLRVMEDYARFALDDPQLSEMAKQARHDLSQQVAAIGQDALLVCREITADVGREIQTEAEYRRESTASIAAAAGKRLSEAMRAIEEHAKLLAPSAAAGFEKLRYAGYELERRIAIVGGAQRRFGSVKLYVLITESLCAGGWFETAERALRGGADCLQLREKGLSDPELLMRAKKLAFLCHDHDALAIINDRPDIAVLSGADGVHVGQDDLSVSAVRRIVGPDRLVGVSTHTQDQIRQAIDVCPDYIAVGPMFATQTKPQDYIAGPASVGFAKTQTALPLVAIGGIDRSNVDAVLEAGDCCLCVCSAIISAEDVEAATREVRQAIDAISQEARS